MAVPPDNSKLPVLHVAVVGFHHKKGCQVEFSYPPLIEGGTVDSHDLPHEWRHLPSMALPDGAHNHIKDTIYFHLPSREAPQKTVYGVSCYRQIDSKDLVNRTADVTRSSVQKSVCVLSRLPLYGLIQAKLELITHAYFDERDFTKVELLEQTYSHLNSTLTESILDGSRIFLGLCPRDLVGLFKHKLVLLFKLLLLERRVLFSGSPVETLCSTLLAVVSLMPGMLEHGLEESSCYSKQQQMSPTLKLANFGIDMEDYLEISYKDLPNHKHPNTPNQQPRSSVSERAETEEQNMGCNSAQTDIDCETACDDKDSSETSSVDPLGIIDTSEIFSVSKAEKNSKTVQAENDKSAAPDGNDSHKQSEQKAAEPVSPNKVKEPDMIDFSSLPSPLCDTDKITHLEAVQDIFVQEIQSDPLFSDESPVHTPEKEVNDPLPSLQIKRTDKMSGHDLVQDIDSPESISEIDKEDGFLWEQDSLLLEIDEELCHDKKEDVIKKSTKSVNNVKDRDERNELKKDDPQYNHQQQPDVQTIDRTDSGKYSEDFLVETSDEDGSFRIVTKVESSKKSQNSGRNSNSGSAQSSPKRSAKAIRNKLSNAFRRSSRDKESPVRNNGDSQEGSFEKSLTNLHQDECGLPLAIFTKGCLCHPYLCLQYYDLLQDVNVKSFVIGATNVLFKQKRHLTDIVIDVSEGKIEIADSELRRQLQLTTADLRFADVLVKAVSDEETAFLEGTEWEGGDEWLRAQFRSYLLGLLTATDLNDEQLLEDYGQVFVSAWRLTHNYRVWVNSPHAAVHQTQPGHPCHGNLTVNDIRVRLTSAMQSSERGRKLNSAVAQTGKYMAQTGRAVGGALNQAKSTVSSWISNWRMSNHD